MQTLEVQFAQDHAFLGANPGTTLLALDLDERQRSAMLNLFAIFIALLAIFANGSAFLNAQDSFAFHVFGDFGAYPLAEDPRRLAPGFAWCAILGVTNF